MPRKAKTQPIQAGPSQSYGQRTQLEDAQRAIPLPQTQGVPQVPQMPTAPPAIPGARGGLSRPSARPGEPVTAGLPIGAGPGPEVLAPPDAGIEKEIASMASYLPTLEHIVSTQDVSDTTRNLVRRLRGSIPPGA